MDEAREEDEVEQTPASEINTPEEDAPIHAAMEVETSLQKMNITDNAPSNETQGEKEEEPPSDVTPTSNKVEEASAKARASLRSYMEKEVERRF